MVLDFYFQSDVFFLGDFYDSGCDGQILKVDVCVVENCQFGVVVVWIGVVDDCVQLGDLVLFDQIGGDGVLEFVDVD